MTRANTLPKAKLIDNNLDQMFQALFESANEGIIVANPGGTIVMINPSGERMFGYKKGELVGKKIEVLIPSHLGNKHIKHRRKYNKDPKPRSMGIGMDLSAVRKDRSEFPVEVSLSHASIEGKTVIIAFVIDITERKKAADIREQTLLLGRVVDESLNEIYLFDSITFRFIRVNQGALDNIGYSMAEMRELTPYDIKPGFTQSTFVKLVFPLIKGSQQKIDFQTIHQRKDGSRYPVEVHLQAFNFGSKPILMAIILDISERKQAEEALNESQERLQRYSEELEQTVAERTSALQESQKLYSTIARNFPDGTINVFDKDLRYTFVEGKELYALGISSEMLIGTRYLDRLAPEIAKTTGKELKEVFKGKAKSIEIQYKNNDYILEAVPLPDEKGKVKQILVIEKNVTEYKRVQDKIKQALKKEQELGELKSRFVSMASHEFRTPLSTILSSASLIDRYQEDSQEEKRKKHTARIKSSVSNLTGILNDFLSLDKLETGKVDTNPIDFDLAAFTQEICHDLETSLKSGQKIDYKYQGRKKVYLDKQMLHNIQINLLSNAIKYSPERSTITLALKNAVGIVTIQIKDQGIGIDEEDQKHLFERFFRAKNAVNLQGTGLGLNIVKKYVDLMGGTIKFSSKVEKGSTFTVTLPQSKK